MRRRDMPQTRFDVYIEQDRYPIAVEHADLERGREMFVGMDRDMDHGRRMGPEFAHHPDPRQRVQIVAERLMLAIEGQNTAMKTAMAAYIVWRVPNIKALHIDTSGDPSLTEIVV